MKRRRSHTRYLSVFSITARSEERVLYGQRANPKFRQSLFMTDKPMSRDLAASCTEISDCPWYDVAGSMLCTVHLHCLQKLLLHQCSVMASPALDGQQKKLTASGISKQLCFCRNSTVTWSSLVLFFLTVTLLGCSSGGHSVSLHPTSDLSCCLLHVHETHSAV